MAALDPHILQLLRLDIALFGATSAQTPLDEFISRSDREQYLWQLYVRGEISGSCSIRGGRMYIEARCLTPYGMLQLNKYEAEFEAKRDKPPKSRPKWKPPEPER
jgi:hypothetical protein